jgi:predicted DNA-binding transcriptional regulator AlpA
MNAIPQHPPTTLDEALWRLPVVLERAGLSGSEILRKEHEGAFLRRRRIGELAVAWLASEVIRWMRERPLAQDVTPVNAPPRGRGRPRKHAA